MRRPDREGTGHSVTFTGRLVTFAKRSFLVVLILSKKLYVMKARWRQHEMLLVTLIGAGVLGDYLWNYAWS